MPFMELERLQAVNRFLKLEINREQQLREIVETAAKICNTPTAIVSLLHEDMQHLIFRFGIDLEQTERAYAFCNYTIEKGEMIVVNDTTKDVRFNQNPYVTGFPNVRFYAGAPLITQDGLNLGSLCVVGLEPQDLTVTQKIMLKALSKQVVNILEFEMSLKILKDQFLKAKNDEIKLRSYFESSTSCHLLIDRDLHVFAFNKAVAAFIKKVFKVDIAAGMQISDVISKTYYEEFKVNYYKALQGVPVVLERELHYDEGPIWWYITFEPAMDPDGQIIGVSYNATDITDRLAQERWAMMQNESLRKIAFIQSHELRRPVSSIKGLMNLFKADGYHADSESLKMLENAVGELDDKIGMIMNHIRTQHSDKA